MPKRTKKVYDIIPPGKGGSSLINLSSGKRKKEKAKKSSKKKKSLFKYWILLLPMVLIGIGLFLYFYLPRAEIKIWSKTEVLNFEDTVIVDIELKDEDVDITSSKEKVAIPGAVFEAEREDEKEFPATGEASEEGRAKGVIRVYNNFHKTQILVKNTRFQPPMDQVMYFRTTKRIEIPVKGFIDVEVTADQPGHDYNIEASTFSIPGLAGLSQYYSVYGKSFSPMTGGFIGKVKTVTEEDINSAKNDLFNLVFSDLKKYLTERVPSGFVLLEQTFQEEEIESSCEAKFHDAVDSFSVKARAKTKALLYKEDYLNQMAMVFFLANKSPSKEIQEDSLKIQADLEQIDWEEGKAVLKFKASIKTYSSLEMDDLEQRLSNKTISETREFLMNWAQIEKVEIVFYPFWVRKVPRNINRINIEVKLDKE